MNHLAEDIEHIVADFCPLWELTDLSDLGFPELFTPAQVRAKANEVIGAILERVRAA